MVVLRGSCSSDEHFCRRFSGIEYKEIVVGSGVFGLVFLWCVFRRSL